MTSESSIKAKYPLLPKIKELITSKKEGTYWDFKRTWPTCTEDLIHDIICLANNPDSQTAYLIFGISDDCSIEGISEEAKGRKNTQQLIDTLHHAIWADTYPRVEVKTIEYGEKRVDVIIIEPEDIAIPYYLLKDFGRGKQTIRAGAIYSRSQDVNTAKTETATSLTTERLWRKRFGLDKTPLERMKQMLSKPDNWEITQPTQPYENDGSTHCYYHKDFPEFTFTISFDKDKYIYDYFMLVTPFFNKPNWWTTRFYYHQTMLNEIIGATPDHLYIPAPEINILNEPRNTSKEYFYGCYYQNSIELSLLTFGLNKPNRRGYESSEYDILMQIIPVFSNNSEKREFENWLHSNWTLLEQQWQNQTVTYTKPIAFNKTYSENFEERLTSQAKMSAALVKLLHKFRWQRSKISEQ